MNLTFLRYSFVTILIIVIFYSLHFLQLNLDKICYISHENLIETSYSPQNYKLMIPSKYHSVMGEIYWLKLREFTYDPRFYSNKPMENLLYLFNIINTLEPHLLTAIDYTLMIYTILPISERKEILKKMLIIIDKAIETNPTNWRFYLQKSQAYNELGKYNVATEVLYQASLISHSPAWLKIFAFNNALFTKNYRIIRKVLKNLISADLTRRERKWFDLNYKWLRSVDDRAELNRLIRNYYNKTGHYPEAEWKVLTSSYLYGLITFAPLDPEGFPYRMDRKTGKIELDSSSPLFLLDHSYKSKFKHN